MEDGDGEGEDTAGKDEEEDFDLFKDLNDDCYKVADTLVHSQFEQLREKESRRGGEKIVRIMSAKGVKYMTHVV